MKSYPATFWNEKYDKKEYIYGTEPNAFFQQEIDKLEKGSILLPADGEGRNGIYAATQGWDVTAFDISTKGMEKAAQLARSRNVDITYELTGALEFHSEIKFDVIGLCYAHFPAQIRKQTHRHVLQFLKPKGIVIFEAFAKAQLGKSSAGPKNLEMLFSIDEVKEEFANLKFDLLREQTIILAEGKGHVGPGDVVQFVGRKNL